MAQRIVSLFPAATEWLCVIGLADRLVAVSHECDYPAAVNRLPRITRSRVDVNAPSEEIDEFVRQSSKNEIPLYDLDTDALAALKPDLIVTQTICDVCAVREADVRRGMSQITHCELLDLSGTTFDEVLSDAQRMIDATGSLPESTAALSKLRARIDRVRESSSKLPRRPRVTLLEWLQPLYCSGHWTPQLIDWAGGNDPLGKIGGRSRQITLEQLVDSAAEILLVACCGLTVARAQQELESALENRTFQSMTCVQQGHVHAFDGSAFFNRCGPRLIDSLETVAQIIQTAILQGVGSRP